MPDSPLGRDVLGPTTQAFYERALDAAMASGVPFLVGGAYALAYYTGIVRHTKDFDLFVRPADCERILRAIAAADPSHHAELTFPHWLGKVYADDAFVDVIFRSGNGVAEVDDGWFEHAEQGEVLGRAVGVCPVEEIIWSKAFVNERERHDGADIAHLIRARAERLDWERLIRRFGPHWRLLFSHLVMFGFIYPTERDRVPERVMRELVRRLEDELGSAPLENGEPVCQGTLLSRAQYLVDTGSWGYRDARIAPLGRMTPEDVASWTEAIDGDR